MNGGYYLLSFFLSSQCKLDSSTGTLRIWRSRTIHYLVPTLIDSGQCSRLLQAESGRKHQLVNADKQHFVSHPHELDAYRNLNWSDMLDLELPPISGSSPA
jgi:hypothetical protein